MNITRIAIAAISSEEGLKSERQAAPLISTMFKYQLTAVVNDVRNATLSWETQHEKVVGRRGN